MTNEPGAYELPDVSRGTYQLPVSSTDFRTFSARNIVLRSGQVRRIDSAREVGDVATEVTVAASEAVIWFPSMLLYPHRPKQRTAPALRLSPKAWQLRG